MAVNSGGQVIAVSSSFTKSYFWDPLSGTTEIAPLPGDTEVRALGLNNLGEVVGDSGPATTRHPFRWNALQGTRLLAGLLGIGSVSAKAINDAGEIVGNAVLQS
ncbi:MAG: hypothetical protein E6H69_12840, partial [Betaproteobacteria bacterium]